jgi:hypothetical protein
MTTTDTVAGPQPLPLLLAELEQRGAAGEPHMRGVVLEHLRGVHQLLVDWQNPAWIRAAGLYHSFYGTDRLDSPLGAPTERAYVRRLLGSDAEDLAWHYCACDFAFFQAGLLADEIPRYRDRFTGAVAPLTAPRLRGMAELLVANEMELALASATYREKKRALLEGIVRGRSGLLTAAAVAAVHRLMAAPGQPVPGTGGVADASATTVRATVTD